MEIVDTLGFLLGTWRLDRSIEDHLSGIHGSFQGMAAVIGSPYGVDSTAVVRARYQETGIFRFGAYSGQAHRSVEYVRGEKATVDIYFSDGRPYVDLNLSTGAWRTRHPCGDDLYEIVTFVRSANVVEERWRVRGPATDYDALTILSRQRQRPKDTEMSSRHKRIGPSSVPPGPS